MALGALGDCRAEAVLAEGMAVSAGAGGDVVVLALGALHAAGLGGGVVGASWVAAEALSFCVASAGLASVVAGLTLVV